VKIANSEPGPKELLATGLAGLLGALLLFAGDMLMYGHWGSGMEFETRHRQVIANASTLRLFAAGLMGPLSLLGYLAGALHVYWRLLPGRYGLRAMVAIGLAATFILGAAEHVVLGAVAFAGRAGAAVPEAKPVLIALSSYLGFIYRAAEVVGYPTMLLLFALVLLKKTTYPRWTALLNPGLLMLVSPLADHLPAPVGAVIVGGFYNLTFCVFFLVSIVTHGFLTGRESPADHGARPDGNFFGGR